MKRERLIFLGLLGLVLAFGMSGCKIILASPDPGTVIEIKPGDKVIFKVNGPVNTLTTRCVWTIYNSETNKVVSEGKNEFELDFNADSKLSNKRNFIMCEYQSYIFLWIRNGQLVWGWLPTDSRNWEIRTNPNSATVITGNYIIENDSDLQLLKGYTTVTGSLIIGPDIESLEGLESLTTIGSDLYISDNDALTSLSGLENLTSVGGYLTIGSNYNLTSLSGLENLKSVGGYLYIGYNDALTSLTGLENITSVGGYLSIYNNPALTSLSGLENITSVSGYLSIGGNDALTSLSSLENITSVGGSLWISGNATLTSLSGIENITSVGGDLEICDNAVLTILGMVGLQRVNGNFSIYSNLLLCTSLAEELMNQVLAMEGIGGTRTISGNKTCTMP